MNFKATASSIAASGGIRPDSHITARPVTATKAGPVALTLVAATLSIVLGGTTVAIAGVIEGRLEISGRSDLSPSSNLTGQRDDTAGAAFLRFVGTGGRRDGRCMSILDSRKPHAEKVRPRRARQNNRCAHRSVRHHERPLPWKASRLRDSSAGFCLEETMGLRSGGSEARQGTLTITGSNVRLGTEMPVALSSFSI